MVQLRCLVVFSRIPRRAPPDHALNAAGLGKCKAQLAVSVDGKAPTVLLPGKILGGVQGMIKHEVIRDRRFLKDEQLIRSEQLAALEEVFDANVRDIAFRGLRCAPPPAKS